MEGLDHKAKIVGRDHLNSRPEARDVRKRVVVVLNNLGGRQVLVPFSCVSVFDQHHWEAKSECSTSCCVDTELRMHSTDY